MIELSFNIYVFSLPMLLSLLLISTEFMVFDLVLVQSQIKEVGAIDFGPRKLAGFFIRSSS